MQLAMIGLGRMGGNMVQRLLEGGHEVIVYDRSAAAIATQVAKGIQAAKDLGDVARQLKPRRVAGDEPEHRVGPEPDPRARNPGRGVEQSRQRPGVCERIPRRGRGHWTCTPTRSPGSPAGAGRTKKFA